MLGCCIHRTVGTMIAVADTMTAAMTVDAIVTTTDATERGPTLSPCPHCRNARWSKHDDQTDIALCGVMAFIVFTRSDSAVFSTVLERVKPIEDAEDRACCVGVTAAVGAHCGIVAAIAA